MGAGIRQTAEGRLLAVGRLDAAQADGDTSGPASDLFEAARGMIDSGASLSREFHAVAYRPIPLDGFPAVGRSAALAGLYTAVSHSGITLAPVIGRFTAEEMLTGQRHPLLAPYGIDRFAAALDQSST